VFNIWNSLPNVVVLAFYTFKNRLDRFWGNRSRKKIRVLYEIKFKLLYIKFDYYDTGTEAVNSVYVRGTSLT